MDTTVEIANKVGAAEITSRVVEDLKDENEQYRKMVMDCIEKVGGGNSVCVTHVDSYMHASMQVRVDSSICTCSVQ